MWSFPRSGEHFNMKNERKVKRRERIFVIIRKYEIFYTGRNKINLSIETGARSIEINMEIRKELRSLPE